MGRSVDDRAVPGLATESGGGPMSAWTREWLLLRRSRTSVFALLLLAVLATAAVLSGRAGIQQQRHEVQKLIELQSQETDVLANWIAQTGDAGYAAYYTFHPTWNAPGPLAFAALGFRDIAPQTLRVRALGLEAQMYENEAFNPELALAGRFDFSFVALYLLPLILIALLHDLVSRERETGRLPLLAAMSPNLSRIWWTRVALRAALAAVALLLPFLIGAALEGATAISTARFAAVVLLYLLFWAALASWLGRTSWPSSVHAAVLVAVWATLTLALPSAMQSAIARNVPVSQGVELTLAHRELVNAAWDQPKEVTMTPFLETHPEWREASTVTGRFHWKWYYAFHQVADQRVAGQVRAYREGLMARQALTERAGWWLPPVGAQVWMHRLAGTDLPAQLAYEDAIRAFHAELRHFYYPYFFEERPFGRENFANAPEFE
jgi:ABC-2 type transport system permease protein